MIVRLLDSNEVIPIPQVGKPPVDHGGEPDPWLLRVDVE